MKGPSVEKTETIWRVRHSAYVKYPLRHSDEIVMKLVVINNGEIVSLRYVVIIVKKTRKPVLEESYATCTFLKFFVSCALLLTLRLNLCLVGQ